MDPDTVHEPQIPEFGWNDEPSRAEVFGQIDAAIYTTDADGWLTYYNDAAAELWGYRPELGKTRWCGSWRIYLTDGTPLPIDQCPMALAMEQGREVRGTQAVLERPDGTLVPFSPYPTPLRDASGRLIAGANMLLTLRAQGLPSFPDRAADEAAAIPPVDPGVALDQDRLTGCLQWALAALADVERSFAMDCERLDGWTGADAEKDRILAQLERRRRSQRGALTELVGEINDQAPSIVARGSWPDPKVGSEGRDGIGDPALHALH